YRSGRPRSAALTALAVHRQQFGAGEIQHFRAQSAVADDPLPHRVRIEAPEGPCGGRIGLVKAKKARAPGRVEAKLGIPCHADPIMRYNAEYHGARRSADAVYSDVLSRILHG